MTDRSYTVSEIEALRSACGNKWLIGQYNWPVGLTRTSSYTESERAIGVEQMVRTHMLAGHTAEDLYAHDRRTKSID